MGGSLTLEIWWDRIVWGHGERSPWIQNIRTELYPLILSTIVIWVTWCCAQPTLAEDDLLIDWSYLVGKWTCFSQICQSVNESVKWADLQAPIGNPCPAIGCTRGEGCGGLMNYHAAALGAFCVPVNPLLVVCTTANNGTANSLR